MFEIGDKVIVYIPEIGDWVKGEVSYKYNHRFSYVNFGNLYFALLPKWYQNEWAVPHHRMEKI